MTLAQLRALLALAHGPAVEREPEGIRSPAGLAHVYLGHEVADLLLRDEVAAEAVWSSWSLARRVQAVKVALALALGLDPGPMGCAVSWRRVGTCFAQEGWSLATAGACRWFIAETAQDAGEVCAPTIATEPDAIKALVLAVEHVLTTR